MKQPFSSHSAPCVYGLVVECDERSSADTQRRVQAPSTGERRRSLQGPRGWKQRWGFRDQEVRCRQMLPGAALLEQHLPSRVSLSQLTVRTHHICSGSIVFSFTFQANAVLFCVYVSSGVKVIHSF